MTLYKIDEDTQIDEFGVDQSKFSLRDKLEYNFMRAKEKEMKPRFMPDDYSAIGGYNAIKDLGLSIPEDISVVGYDGINYSQLISPRLTTYSQDTTKIGKIAARQLISLIEDPQTTFTEVITVEGSLVEGDSVAQI